jgi:transcriptional regulator with PAS, ATPase and Fis domain
VNFTDAKGFLRSVPAGKFFNPIHLVCKKIAGDNTGFQGCISAIRETSKNTDLKIQISRCHAGFSTLAVPIHIKEQYLGCVFCDGFILQESEREQKALISEKVQSLFPDDIKLKNYIDKLPVLSSAELDFLTQLVSMVVEEILFAKAKLWSSIKQVETLKAELKTRYNFDKMIGKSQSMQSIYSMIDRVKDSSSFILIQGENGTGKELIARALHYNSHRQKGPFVAINCGAFNENLLESELFGHIKGAFTGAIKDRIGLFEAADDGTLFLDEVGEMPASMQVKLLRVLQDGIYSPVGSTETKTSKARVVCATNKNLAKMMEEGQFRMDLFYRLNVINLYIPPLRERMEDVPLLIEYFIKNFAHSMQTPEKLPSRECLSRLLSYSWPGNVRELENEIERLYVLSGDDKILEESNLSSRLKTPSSAVQKIHHSGSLKEALEHVEIDMIREGLQRTHWNKSQLAKELGISRTGLILKVEKYGLEKKAS